MGGEGGPHLDVEGVVSQRGGVGWLSLMVADLGALSCR